MEYSEDSAAQCGECGMCGSLKAIQSHYLENHCEPEPQSESPKLVSPPKEMSDSHLLSFDEGKLSTEDNFQWKDEHVLLLIRLVEKFDEEFNNGLKKKVWLKIALEISKVINKKISYEQVDAKWKGLKKTYKKIKDHNNQSGNSIKRWQFFQAMDSFLSKKPEVQPVATCSSTSAKVQVTGTDVNTNEEPSSSKGIGAKKRKSDNPVQKRHEEKMNKFDKFLKIFQISVEHQVGRTLED